MLQFIGTGSAFNTKLGNNSAFIKEGETLFLIDCGSNTFDRLRQSNILEGVKNIYVLLTHTHPDHIGSLGDLIFYSYYSMGKVAEPCLTVLCPKGISIALLLKGMGVNPELYELEKFEETKFLQTEGFEVFIDGREVTHVKELKSFAYVLSYNNQDYYYSGDSNEISPNIIGNLEKGAFDYFYQDTCKADYEGNVHLSLNKLQELIKPQFRSKVYCMHLDEGFSKEEAEGLGFNVATSISHTP